MHDSSCVFCKIIQGILPSTVIKENEHVVTIKNVDPKAPIHYLIIPKKHLVDISAFSDKDSELGWQVLKMARDLAHDELKGVGGFNLIANNGKEAGQSVLHMHFHFIAGKNIYSGGLTL